MRPRSFRDSLGRYRPVASGAPFAVCTWQTRWAYSSRAPVDHSGGTVADFHGLPFALRTARGSLRGPIRSGFKEPLPKPAELSTPSVCRAFCSVNQGGETGETVAGPSDRARTGARFPPVKGASQLERSRDPVLIVRPSTRPNENARNQGALIFRSSGIRKIGPRLVADCGQIAHYRLSFALLRLGPDRPQAKIGSNWG
jgi:hypothetical protein